jgi:hypothetical protein
VNWVSTWEVKTVVPVLGEEVAASLGVQVSTLAVQLGAGGRGEGSTEL